jgi:UDP-N-acetylglucosamine acyltransferase
MKIHPTAIVDPSAELAEDVEIGPWAVVERDVIIGSGTKLWPRAFVGRWTQIGKDCQVHMGAVVGHEPHDVSYEGKRSFLKVGDRNIFREYSFIHRGAKPETATVLGDDNYFMATSHVGHNARIGNRVILAPTALLGGHVVVEDNVFLSAQTAIHQFCRIGRLAFLSGLTGVNQDVPPFVIAGGRPAGITSLNREGLKRAGIDSHGREKLKEAFRTLFRSSLSLPDAMAKIEEGEVTAEVRHLLDFIRSSERGITLRSAQS